MRERTVPELIECLQSDDGDAVFAAEELGEAGDPAAVRPLIGALSKLSYGRRNWDFSIATAVIEALARLGDPKAAAAILTALEQTRGHDVVPRVACDALVQLRATGTVPALNGLLRNKKFADYADELAGAVVELGGPREAPVFLELLSTRREETVKAAAAEALGRLKHLPAAPVLTKLRRSESEHVTVALAALHSLILMDAPGADAELRDEMACASEYFEKFQILRILREQRITGVADLLVAQASDPAWADSDVILVETLDAAARLGSEAAMDRLRNLSADSAESPCSRTRAATILLDLGETQYLSGCLDFLLDFLPRNGGHAEEDARDSFGRSNETQTEIVKVVERLAARDRKYLLPIVDCLYALRRERGGFIQDLARGAVLALTPTETYAEYDTWRAAQSS